MLFYLVGSVVSCILGLRLLSIEEKKLKGDKETLQYGMISVMALLSWITVIMLAWGRFKNKKKGD